MGDMDVPSQEPLRGVSFEDVLAMFREYIRETREYVRESREYVRENTQERERENREYVRKIQEEARKIQEEAQERERENREYAQKIQEEARTIQEEARKIQGEAQERERKLQKEAQESARKIQEEAQKRERENREYARKIQEEAQERARKIQEEAQERKETERMFKEMRAETDRIMKETALQMKETDRKISKLGGRIGDLVEQMIAPNILEKFKKLDYVFGKVAPNVRYTDSQGQFVAEVDLLLENGDSVLVVEVKTNLTINDVKEHVKRMEKLRIYADGHQDRRKLLGAVAGAIASEGAKAFAVKNGFFVLEQSGDTIKIAVPQDFKPREW
jgi:DNA repair exonuclease SbcCD ATPase subunit